MDGGRGRVVVIGGGISGLAGAHALALAGVDVTVVEASDRLGGKIKTSSFAGRNVDEGPDAFLARVPHAVELSRRLGLGDDLVSPGTGQASLWIGGRLVPIPAGLVLGVPAEFGPLAASGILSPAGLARAEQEPDLRGQPVTDDVTIGDLIRRRYGAEVHERLVDPLLGGINAGRTEELSLDVGAAQLADVARRFVSLTRGLAAQRAAHPPDPSAPIFYAPRSGMASLVEALVGALSERGADIHTGTAVDGLRRSAGRWLVQLAGGHELEADGVLIAVPAPAAAQLLGSVSAEAASSLAAIHYASVALVTLAFPADAAGQPITGSGFLVPRNEGRLLTAASVFSNKWPHLAQPGTLVVRASVGRWGDERGLDMDDDALVERVVDELAQALALRGGPIEARVSRWAGSFPQFPAGHLSRVEAIERVLADDAPGLAMAGAHLRGVGIPACIGGAQAAAARLVTAAAGA